LRGNQELLLAQSEPIAATLHPEIVAKLSEVVVINQVGELPDPKER
jgi:hypothetical protein